ncbi:MAG: hypothetical protein A2Y14_03540 [Verrucomicrobia bacterium GWF2_51_19]|nr:MAG: hypothetical protein A2Y14_03540 [Verrucomicrobia bacterium GWF2_51_19]HCJ12399.1 biopolymer transporter ExbD [Opitutae bacterium]
MAHHFHRKTSLDALSEINVTPLIDLAFSLLIIFMITTPLLEQTIPLSLPKEAKKAQSADKEEVKTISLQGNRYFWGEQVVTLDELDRLLGTLAALKTPPILHIRAEGTLPYQRVVDVLDKVKQHNLSKISLDTEAK